MAAEPPRGAWARLLALLRTSAFQLTLFYTGLFSISAALLTLFFYWSTIGLLVRESDATLKAEITGLAEQYGEHGLQRLVQVIVNRVATDRSGAMLYLFATRDNQPLAGNLLEWPRVEPDVDGWVDFVHHRQDGRDVPARARVYWLQDGLHLLVGRNMLPLAEDLIARGADVNAVNGAGKTPYAVCVDKNDPLLAQLLQQHGAQ